MRQVLDVEQVIIRRGPRTEPLGTPEATGTSKELSPIQHHSLGSTQTKSSDPVQCIFFDPMLRELKSNLGDLPCQKLYKNIIVLGMPVYLV